MLRNPASRSSAPTLLAAALVAALATLPLAACTASVTTETEGGGSTAATSTSYEDLVALFEEWREFEKPELVDGVYDYTAAAMAEPAAMPVSKRRRV